MNSSKKILLNLFLCLMLLPAAAFSQSNQAKTLANTIADRMAIAHRLQEAPHAIKAQFEQNPLQLSAEKNKRMLALFDEAYDSELLLNDFKAALQEKLVNQPTNNISEWLEKPETQTIMDANQHYYTLQGKRKRLMTMYELDQKQPSEQRTAVMDSIADASSATEASVTSSVIILRSVITALSRLSDQRNFSDAQIETIVNNFKGQMQSQASQQIKKELLIKYYTVKLPALKSYLTFMQMQRGQWLNNAINQSMESAYETAATRFLESINNG